MKLGCVPSHSSSVSPLPAPVAGPKFSLPPPSSVTLDYSSAFLCRLPLNILQSRAVGLELAVETGYVSTVGTAVVDDQSHLTQVSVGCDEDPMEYLPTEEIVQQVCCA